ncbi:hypothetical protein [Desulfurobacterium atlanticum]|uniref:HPt domain-containing protein n=1 Tax=Desulfurobacterium atlanticum TaxID=240169 RepID=A0A238ZVL5_9BACT|nr:hypothetical protein [Desulfurobacterium atlanticum]SNR86703.1 hypothetical protein SAMN06265340_1124 [Desulfurobacterium atlanticum]
MQQYKPDEIRKFLEKKIKPVAEKRFIEFGMDKEEAEELIEEGIDSIFSKIFLIEKFLKDKNYKALIKLTHSIKGVLLNLGLENEAEAFKKVKHMYENGKNYIEIETQTRKAIKMLLNEGK